MATKTKVTDAGLRKFVEGYLDAALWSSTDEDGNPLDRNFSTHDIAEEAVRKAVTESLKFYRANRADLDATGATDERNGHDFWLTRNRHGAGFWDRGYGAVGDRLTKASHAFGEAYLYEGDDGMLYLG